MIQPKQPLLFWLLCCCLYNEAQEPVAVSEEPTTQTSQRQPTEPLIPFSFEKRPLLDILNELAEKKNLIIVLPTGAALNALQKQVITYHPQGSPVVTLDQAWQLLVMFLELSGFNLIHRKETIYAVIDAKGIEGGAANRETLPLYVDTAPDKLPTYPERIRYFSSLRNIKVPQPPEQANHYLTTMLKQLLSPLALVLFEPGSNSIIMSDKATQIASAVAILNELDARGYQEQVDYVPLEYVPAQRVVQIFDTLKKASGELPPPGAPAAEQAPSYFAQDTRIIAHEANNAVIVMGKQSAVERITEFIKNDLDQAPESGKSILHPYDLQYLDAQTFAPQLQAAVSFLMGGNGQAGQQPPRAGYERSLQGVQVMAEALVEVQKERTTEKELLEKKGGMEVLGVEGIQKIGGNRLIVAATQDDWVMVEQLIKKLDTKRKQVLLEMYIIDFTYNNQTIVSSDLRNLTDSCGNGPSGVQFLASHISPVSSVLGATPTQLAQDLLGIIGPTQLSNVIASGSTLLSFNDPVTPGIFGLLQLLQEVVTAKIQSHPYLVITDHQTGSIESQELRFIQGNLVTTTNGTFTIPLENVSASLKVVATPHIAANNRIRLEISFTADEFISTASNTRLTRELRTTATLSSGQILAMGGLLRDDTIAQDTFTPVLGRVPLAGVFFRGENRDDTITNIALLASPVIIEPRKVDPVKKEHTIEKINEVILYENIQENLRDPIYNWFFKEQANSDTINNYLEDSINMHDVRVPYQQLPVGLITKKKFIAVPKPSRIGQLKELLSDQEFVPRRSPRIKRDARVR